MPDRRPDEQLIPPRAGERATEAEIRAAIELAGYHNDPARARRVISAWNQIVGLGTIMADESRPTAETAGEASARCDAEREQRPASPASEQLELVIPVMEPATPQPTRPVRADEPVAFNGWTAFSASTSGHVLTTGTFDGSVEFTSAPIAAESEEPGDTDRTGEELDREMSELSSALFDLQRRYNQLGFDLDALIGPEASARRAEIRRERDQIAADYQVRNVRRAELSEELERRRERARIAALNAEESCEHLAEEDMTENAAPETDPRPEGYRRGETWLLSKDVLKRSIRNRAQREAVLGAKGAFVEVGAWKGWTSTFKDATTSPARRSRRLIGVFTRVDVTVAMIAKLPRHGLEDRDAPLEFEELVAGPLADEWENLSEEAGPMYHKFRSPNPPEGAARDALNQRLQEISRRMDAIGMDLNAALQPLRLWFYGQARRRFRKRDGGQRSLGVVRYRLGIMPGKRMAEAARNTVCERASAEFSLGRSDYEEHAWAARLAAERAVCFNLLATHGIAASADELDGRWDGFWGSVPPEGEGPGYVRACYKWAKALEDQARAKDIVPRGGAGDKIANLCRAFRRLHHAAKAVRAWEKFRAAIERHDRKSGATPYLGNASGTTLDRNERCDCCGRRELAMEWRAASTSSGPGSRVFVAEQYVGRVQTAISNNPGRGRRIMEHEVNFHHGYVCRECLDDNDGPASCCTNCGCLTTSALLHRAIGDRRQRCPNCAAHQGGSAPWRWDDAQGEYVAQGGFGRAGYHNDPARCTWRRPQSPTKQAVGVEIECEIPPDKQSETSDKIRAAGWAFERDGSLDGERGVELVSPPLAYDAGPHHLDLSHFRGELAKVLGALPKGSLGYDCGKGYGLHVNLNAGNWSSQKIATYCSLFCVDRGQKTLFEKLAGREENQWARYHPCKGAQSEKYFAAALKGGVGSSRIEVRIFRSTLRPESLLGAVAFCCDVERFVLSTRAKVDDAGALVAWLEKNASAETLQLFANRRATRLITPLAAAYREKPTATKPHVAGRLAELPHGEGRGQQEPEPEEVTLATACLAAPPGPDDAVIEPEPWTAGPPIDLEAAGEEPETEEDAIDGDALLAEIGEEENEPAYEDDEDDEEEPDEDDEDDEEEPDEDDEDAEGPF